jgi:hypothetical protein
MRIHRFCITFQELISTHKFLTNIYTFPFETPRFIISYCNKLNNSLNLAKVSFLFNENTHPKEKSVESLGMEK